MIDTRAFGLERQVLDRDLRVRELLEQAWRQCERLAEARADALVDQVLEQLGRERAALVDLELRLREPAELLGVALVLDAAQAIRAAGAAAPHHHLRVEERDVRIEPLLRIPYASHTRLIGSQLSSRAWSALVAA
jgi:hypothetical protein